MVSIFVEYTRQFFRKNGKQVDNYIVATHASKKFGNLATREIGIVDNVTQVVWTYAYNALLILILIFRDFYIH